MQESELQDLSSDISRLLTLAILYEHPMHGYGILDELKRRLGRKVSPGLLYPFLRLLEENALLRHRNVKIGRKNKKVYELTSRGKRMSLGVFNRMTNILWQAIAPTLDTCANCGCKLYEGGHVQVVGGKRMTFCCVHCADAYLRHPREI